MLHIPRTHNMPKNISRNAMGEKKWGKKINWGIRIATILFNYMYM
jgi:hypothetical protein